MPQLDGQLKIDPLRIHNEVHITMFQTASTIEKSRTTYAFVQ